MTYVNEEKPLKRKNDDIPSQGLVIALHQAIKFFSAFIIALASISATVWCVQF